MVKKAKRNIEMAVAPVISLKDRSRTAFRSQIRVHNEELGILLPEVYGPVADKTAKCKQLFFWGLEEALSVVTNLKKREIACDFFSLYAPQKLFEDDKSIDELVKSISQSGIPFGKFALEVYADFLLQRSGKAFENTVLLREKGIKIMLLQFGSENFPVSKLSFLPVDLLCIDDHLADCLTGDTLEREYAKGILLTAKNMGKQLYFDKITSKSMADSFSEFLDYGSGSHFGNYISSKHISVNWAEKP